MSDRSADVLELRQILWSWDPTGVSYLTEVDRDEISIGRGPDRARDVAEAVTSWFGCRGGDRNEARRSLM